MAAVEVADVWKRYGSIEALRGTTLAVPEGTIFGLLGPNGAGKSTLIKALVGALRPDSGSVRVLGLDPLRDKAALRAKIGYMPQSPALYEDLSPRQNLRFFGSAHQVPGLEARIDEVLAFTELSARADDRVFGFSGGMKKRVSLACALIHRPRMLILDEPTAAVDPHLKLRSWELFRSMASEGVTLVISTHLMDEALLCDSVAIQRQGAILAVDTPKAILARGRTRIAVTTADATIEREAASSPASLAAALKPFGLRDDISALSLDADTLEMIILELIASENTAASS